MEAGCWYCGQPVIKSRHDSHDGGYGYYCSEACAEDDYYERSADAPDNAASDAILGIGPHQE